MRIEANDLTVSRRGSQVIAKNSMLQVIFDLSKGTWSYIDKTGHSVIRNAYTKVTLRGGTTFSTSDPGVSEFITSPVTEDEFGVFQPVTFSHHAEGSGFRTHLYLNCYHQKPFVILTVGVENLNGRPLALEQINLIDVSPRQGSARGGVHLGGPPSSYNMFLSMDTPAFHGVRKLYDGFSVNRDHSTESCYDGLLYDTESERSLVFGFLGFEKWRSAICVGYDAQTQSGREAHHVVNHWALFHTCENYPCESGKEVRSEPLYLNFATAAADSYALYGEMLSRRMDAKSLSHVFSSLRVNPGDQRMISENQIVAQLDRIGKNQLFLASSPGGLEFVQLDSSWETAIGSQEAHPENFPSGMKWIAEQIHGKGLKAGLQIVPFCVDIDAELPKTHPEYFLKDEGNNQPASIVLPDGGGEAALLDVSHPGAQAHVREYIRRAVDEWGYDLIKADLLAYTIGPMTNPSDFSWHETSLTSVELYRLGLRLLAEAIQDCKKQAVFAACNTCSRPSVGSLPLNEDLSAHGRAAGEGLWNERSGLKQFVNGYIAHLPVLSKTWTNTYGPLLIDEPLPLNEALVAITTAALSGGVVTFADDLTELKASRAELLGKIFPLTGVSATPIDLYKEACPQIWNLPVRSPHGAWNVVGVFNWGDASQDVEFSLQTLGLDRSKYYLVHDFWNREFLGQARGWMTLFNLPPRSVKLLCVRPEEDTPQLLSTDMHFTQGSVEILSGGWDHRSQSFLAVCKPPRHSKGTLFIHVPAEYIPGATACYGSSYHFCWRKPVYEIEFGPTTNLVHVSIQFAKTSG